MKKKIWIVLLCALMLMSVSGCNKMPKEITLLTWEDYVPQTILQDFTQQTGIAVHCETAETNEEMLEKIETSPGAYDLIIATDYAIDTLVQKQLLEEIDYDDIPNYRYVSDGYKGLYYDPNNQYTVPYSTAGILIGYDPQKAGIEIDAFADLLAPELAGKVTYVDDPNAIVGIANLILQQAPDYTETYEESAKILQALSRSILSVDANMPESPLADGTAAAGVMFTSQLGYAMAVNPNLEVVYPKEGFIYTVDAMAIPAGADGKAGALALMDYIHDPVVNGKIMPEICCSTTNVSAVQFMEESYRTSEGYNIQPDKAAEGVLFKPLDETTQTRLNYIYKKYFKDWQANGTDTETE